MDERNFRIWMEKEKSYHTARTYTARCMRVEQQLDCDLDEEYKQDNGADVISKLKYSRSDERKGVIPQNGMIFSVNVDVYMGMHALRSSVKKYFEFLRLNKRDLSKGDDADA